MTRHIVLLRHGPTDWNAEKRLQGRTDTALSEAGRQQFGGRRIPAAYRGWTWYASPLRRTQETAALLGLQATAEPALIEMNWGAYEGSTLEELHAKYGAAFAAYEALGLDLQPPGGESPRQVQQRLLPWLRNLPGNAGAVTHKGVIRAILALAFDWPMLGKPPVRLDWRCLQEFSITEDGRPVLAAANVPLE
ncbi:histidine phosphatase family protein [Ferrovibrio terrae]|uniref:histidine phosphatase family protein n=1 Tax=Ferrovibrio terrae TaxID=2594003 RepID=UPI003138173F